jgi:3-hydroxymyristoyl/3-hydroxydecanoyl-(acyl carrier protein) dehydratase
MIDNSLKKTLDKDFVEKLLPQKFPFVMVDKMYDFTETSLVSGFTILEESIAQSIALHTGYQFFLRNEPAPMGYIGSIKDIEILKLPKLGDEIQTTVSILQEFAGITLVDAITKIDDIVIASGQMKTVLAK